MADDPEILVGAQRGKTDDAPVQEPPAEPVEPATDEGEDQAPQPAAAPRPRRSPLVLVLGLWAVLATVAAVVLLAWWAPLHNEAQDRQEVQALAGEFAAHLTTFEGEQIDAWVEETQAWATGAYADQLTRLFDPELREALGAAQVSSEGSVLHLFVQEAAGDEASVFAVVVQRVDNRFAEQPFEDELRMEITMQRSDGDWLVSDVAVLGPGGMAAPGPAPGLEEAP